VKNNPLREWRQSLGWTAVELALKLGLSEQSILSFEKGRFEPSAENVDKLAQLMDLTPSQLRLRWHFWKASQNEA
jgi:transcriptional regulator with XRE-family HTH domain